MGTAQITPECRRSTYSQLKRPFSSSFASSPTFIFIVVYVHLVKFLANDIIIAHVALLGEVLVIVGRPVTDAVVRCVLGFGVAIFDFEVGMRIHIGTRLYIFGWLLDRNGLDGGEEANEAKGEGDSNVHRLSEGKWID